MNIIDPTTYLRRDNPRLIQLEADYAALNLPFGHTQWKQHQYNIGLETFRSDGPYLGLGAIRGEQQYRTMYEYVKSIDKYDYLDFLKEDDAFGMHTYEYDGKVVSRDLLDSIMEVYAVQEALYPSWEAKGGSVNGPLLPVRWLDIGSGYGRFAHRLCALYPERHITCIDAIATSTFLCEFYAQYRGFADKCRIVTLPEVYYFPPQDIFDIACNIHSWSEVSASAINWWLDKLVFWNVPYLFIVPHDPRFVCVNEDGSIGDFRPLLEQHGYKLIYEKPKYPPGIDGLYPEVVRYMYKLEQ